MLFLRYLIITIVIIKEESAFFAMKFVYSFVRKAFKIENRFKKEF
jgi:hypothetical protein